MMKKILLPLVASIVAISANSAIAEPEKWYIGAGAGMSTYNDWASEGDIRGFKNKFEASLGITNFTGSETSDSDDKAFGFKLFGGYSFTDKIAVELSYINMGEVDANSSSTGTFTVANSDVAGDLSASASASVDAFTLDAVLNYPITSSVVLLAKGGLYAADTKLEIDAKTSLTTVGFNDSITESSTGLHVGIGVGFKVTQAIDLRAEWELLDNVEANNGESDVDLISASLLYNF